MPARARARPTFKDWPASYYRWLERAWRGGLRVYVNLLVDNAALCDLYPKKRNGCNEMRTALLELKRLHELEDYIDAQSGGPGKGWFRIVSSPFQARRVINSGKLAVIPGIEISALFDCGVYNGVPTCDAKHVAEQLDVAYDLGVRQMELINKFDNGFGGVAGDAGTFGVVVNQGNKKQTGRYWDMRTCETESDEVSDHTQHTVPGTERDSLLGAGLQAFLPPGTAPVYTEPPHCNAYGLTELGEQLIRGMMRKGMIVDSDHLSVLARRQAMSVLESENYSGVVSSHSWSTPDAYPRIYRLGGVITPYAGGSVGFVSSTARNHRAKGVGPGANASRLRGVTKSLGRSLHVRSAPGGAKFVYGVRKGKVRWVALASRTAARTLKSLESYVKLARLR